MIKLILSVALLTLVGILHPEILIPVLVLVFIAMTTFQLSANTKVACICICIGASILFADIRLDIIPVYLCMFLLSLGIFRHRHENPDLKIPSFFPLIFIGQIICSGYLIFLYYRDVKILACLLLSIGFAILHRYANRTNWIIFIAAMIGTYVFYFYTRNENLILYMDTYPVSVQQTLTYKIDVFLVIIIIDIVYVVINRNRRNLHE